MSGEPSSLSFTSFDSRKSDSEVTEGGTAAVTESGHKRTLSELSETTSVESGRSEDWWDLESSDSDSQWESSDDADEADDDWEPSSGDEDGTGLMNDEDSADHLRQEIDGLRLEGEQHGRGFAPSTNRQTRSSARRRLLEMRQREKELQMAQDDSDDDDGEEGEQKDIQDGNDEDKDGDVKMEEDPSPKILTLEERRASRVYDAHTCSAELWKAMSKKMEERRQQAYDVFETEMEKSNDELNEYLSDLKMNEIHNKHSLFKEKSVDSMMDWFHDQIEELRMNNASNGGSLFGMDKIVSLSIESSTAAVTTQSSDGELGSLMMMSVPLNDQCVVTRQIPFNALTAPLPLCSAYVPLKHAVWPTPNTKKELLMTCHFDDCDDKEQSEDLIWMAEGSLFDQKITDFDYDTEYDEMDDLAIECAQNNPDLIGSLNKILPDKLIKIRMNQLKRTHLDRLCEEQARLVENGHDLNPDGNTNPLDSFLSVFCPRDGIYDCAEHGLPNYPRSDRSLMGDVHDLRLPDEKTKSLTMKNDDLLFEPVELNEKNANGADEETEALFRKYMNQIIKDESGMINVDEYLNRINNNQQKSDSSKMKIESEIESDHHPTKSVWDESVESTLARLLFAVFGDDKEIVKLCFPSDRVADGLDDRLDAILSQMSQHPSKLNEDGSPLVSHRTKSKKRKSLLSSSKKSRHMGTALYDPCGDHDGSDCFTSPDCHCHKFHTHCEKFCSCVRCLNAFPGCSCKSGQCRTQRCCCFAAGRECDPDLCHSCFSYLPKEMMDHLKNAAIMEDHPPHSHSHSSHPLSASKQASETMIKDMEKMVDTVSLCSNVKCRQMREPKVMIGKSRVHGLGCFASQRIRKNELISEYVGEYLDLAESERRGSIYDKVNLSYLFDVSGERVMDAHRKGVSIKFANHSKENANCYAKVMSVNGTLRICLFAKRDIKASEEILFDYRHSENNDRSGNPDWYTHHVD